MKEAEIRQLQASDWSDVVSLANENIGANYYRESDFELYFGKQRQYDLKASYLMIDANNPKALLGVRITFSPGSWLHSLSDKVNINLWKAPANKVAYFKTIIVSQKFIGQGFGPKLTLASIDYLREHDTLAVLCHSWKESPHNSSQKYLLKLGFQEIMEHPKFWNELDYECITCHPNRCRCTAIEMIKYL